MSNLSQESDDDKIVDHPYRTIIRAVAYARPDGEAMIQLEVGQEILARPAYVEGWLAWIEDGDVIGYVRLGDLELYP
jgi:hypothetical protein